VPNFCTAQEEPRHRGRDPKKKRNCERWIKARKNAQTMGSRSQVLGPVTGNLRKEKFGQERRRFTSRVKASPGSSQIGQHNNVNQRMPTIGFLRCYRTRGRGGVEKSPNQNEQKMGGGVHTYAPKITHTPRNKVVTDSRPTNHCSPGGRLKRE